MEIVEADPVVVAHAEEHIANICTDRLTYVGDRIYEAQFRGEKGVRRVLDQLRGRCIGNYEGSLRPREERPDPRRRTLVRRADHNPLGVETVSHGVSLAEELGIGHDGYVAAPKHALDDQSRTHRHRLLVHDDRIVLQHT